MKVLIVDDAAEAAEILAEGARLHNCEVVDVVSTGQDAIGKAIMTPYDLITLDIRMPGISGLEALSVIRGIRSHSILAIVSAYVHDLDADAKATADLILSKPVSLSTFQELLTLAWEISERRVAIRNLGKM
ncbi:MAG: response regulator [Candidatus Latescibacteria bacterium]|nr:response regulator [Candidatus Latescibacterota bacterium]MBT5831267.1 response regulator [Candidatus Latescibacterota bacterium]